MPYKSGTHYKSATLNKSGMRGLSCGVIFHKLRGPSTPKRDVWIWCDNFSCYNKHANHNSKRSAGRRHNWRGCGHNAWRLRCNGGSCACQRHYS